MKENIEKIIIIFIVTLMIILGITFIKTGIDIKNSEEPIYIYKCEKKSNYEVLLKENDFYETNKISSGMLYAAQSIDSISINFKYNFKANKKENINYNYNITANLIGIPNYSIDDKEDVIWNREFIALDNIYINRINKDEFLIDQNINIDYEYYKNMVNSYEKEYGLAINATLNVRLNIYSNIDLANLSADNKQIKDFIELNIPITNTVVQIKQNNNDFKSESINLKKNDITYKEIIYYIIGIIFILLGTFFIIYNKAKRIRTAEEIYKSNIKNILKDYRELIITMKNKPDLENLNIMYLDLFNDIIDVAEQNQKNIIHYVVDKNKQSNLYVIVDKYAYIYSVTSKKYKI